MDFKFIFFIIKARKSPQNKRLADASWCIHHTSRVRHNGRWHCCTCSMGRTMRKEPGIKFFFTLNGTNIFFLISWLWWKQDVTVASVSSKKKKNLSGFGLTLDPLCSHGLPLGQNACQAAPPPPIESHDHLPTGCDAIKTDVAATKFAP